MFAYRERMRSSLIDAHAQRPIYRTLQIVITALIAVMIVPVTLQIFSRFVDFIPRYIWTEEVARFCLIWMIMLGASVAVRDGTHFDVDVLPTSEDAARPGGRAAWSSMSRCFWSR